jgi:hypothetical protein
MRWGARWREAEAERRVRRLLHREEIRRYTASTMHPDNQ